MAKAHPLLALNPSGSLAENAPLMLYLRLGELMQYDRFVHDPAKVQELHDMRIAAKRLRYTLEVFDQAYEGSERRKLRLLTDSVKSIQEQIGNIHDCDFRVGAIEQYSARHTAKRPEIKEGLHRLVGDERNLRDRLYAEFAKFWLELNNNRDFERRFVIVCFAPRIGSVSSKPREST